MYYPALFLPAREGGYSVLFPDIPEALTQGEDIAEAISMARDVLGVCLEEYAREDRQFPKPSLPDALKDVLAKRMLDDGIDVSRMPLIQMVKAPNLDKRIVKLNISLARSTLEAVDEKAKALGMTRSGFLARAALAYK